MSMTMPDLNDPKMITAMDELKAMILQKYPDAVFEPEVGGEPLGVYLVTRVDVDDTDEVLDLVVDRVVEFIAEEDIPIHVLPLPTDERARKLREEMEATKHLPPKPLYD
jgi:hypothetical protein